MKNLTLFFLIIIVGNFKANSSTKFVWFSSPKIENIGLFSEKLQETENNGVDFIIISGKIFKEKSEFKNLKRIIDNLQIPVKILPSFSDFVEYQDFIEYTENFENTNFLLKKDNLLFVGIKSENKNDKNYPFFRKEDLTWLANEMETFNNDTLRIFLFTDSMPSEIINFNRLKTIFSKHYFSTVFLQSEPNKISTEYYFIYPKCQKNVNEIVINNSELRSICENKILFNRKFNNMISSEALRPEVQKKLFDYDKSKLKLDVRFSIDASVYGSGAVYKKRVYVADNTGLLSCIDKDGTLLWDYDLFGDPVGLPVIKDNFVVEATLQGDLITLNALSGDALQTIGFDFPIISNLKIIGYKWQISTMSAKKSGSDAAVIFATSDGKINCYDVETLEKIWDIKISDSLKKATLFVTRNQVFVAIEKKIISLNKKNGAIIWSKKFKEEISNHLVYGKIDLFVYSKNKIYSFDIITGAENKIYNKYNVKEIFLSKNRKLLYIVDEKGNLIFALSKNGKYKIKYPLNLNAKKTGIIDLRDKLIIANGKKIFRINGKGKYSQILGSVFPVSTLRKFDKKHLLIGDENGNFAIFKLIAERY